MSESHFYLGRLLDPKTNQITRQLFGVAWLPYYVTQFDGQIVVLPAFGE